MTKSVEQAKVVIIGGGILGASIAYHYTRRFPGRVIVLERNTLASAASSRAAALLTRARQKAALMPLIAQTYADIADLELQLHESLDLRQVGSLHVAASRQREQELRDLVTLAAAAEIAVEWLQAGEAVKRAPWLAVDTVQVIASMPEDGFIDPYRLATAYARAARAQGAELRQHTAVLEILREGQRIVGIRTDQGNITTDWVVDAAGAWAVALAAQAGVALPVAPVRSQYWITAPHPLFPRDHSSVILPDANAYSRPELGALLFGLRETPSVSVDARALPTDLDGCDLSPDNGWPSLAEGAAALGHFLPILPELEIRHYIAGLSTYTPDGLFVLGAVPAIPGFLAATGCCGAGIAAAGGIGASIAALTAGRPAPWDLTPFRPERFGAVDPFSTEFRRRCEQARSFKISG